MTIRYYGGCHRRIRRVPLLALWSSIHSQAFLQPIRPYGKITGTTAPFYITSPQQQHHLRRRRSHSGSGGGSIRTMALNVHIRDDEIIRVTRDWFDRIVVGWNLCPFANRHNMNNQNITTTTTTLPPEDDVDDNVPATPTTTTSTTTTTTTTNDDTTVHIPTLKFEVIRGTNEQTILAAVLVECMIRQEYPGTTLVIAPECHPDCFASYLEYCTTLEEDILPGYTSKNEENNEEEGGSSSMDRDIQIAPFHPLFEFADSNGVDVWTNRSPYPIFHILREDDVSKAVAMLDGDASKVWKRNLKLLQDFDDTLGSATNLEAIVRDRDVHQQHEDMIRTVLQRNKFRLDVEDPEKQG